MKEDSLQRDFLSNIRNGLRESLPENDIASPKGLRSPKYMFIPQSHAKALDLESTIVEGIRGAGKSFWFEALNKQEHRNSIGTFNPKIGWARNVSVSQGFGVGTPEISKDVLKTLAKKYEPRQIWRTVIASKIKFNPPFPQAGSWEEKVKWVTKNPEEYDLLIHDLDKNSTEQGQTHLVLFDALDRLADNWEDVRPLARGLFQLALDTRSLRSIRTKLFVRPDMLEDKIIMSFPDASKLLAGKVSLDWRRADLYALIFQCLGNAEANGETFRKLCEKSDIGWGTPEQKIWLLPKNLQTDEELQKKVFHAITGPAMASGASGHKRGIPYTWLVNHLMDGREQVSPRSFAAALRKAAESAPQEDWPFPLNFKAIHSGVQHASDIRVNEITEDYPWVNTVMEPLRGNVIVPCVSLDIEKLWEKNKTIKSLEQVTAQTGKEKLPPQHITNGPAGVLADLEELGLVQKLRDGRIQIPDVYRIGFGLGRKGGVRPLR